MCLTMSQLLQRAARRYGAMDPEAMDDLFSRRGLGMLSINEMSMERLEARLSSLRAIQHQEHEAGLDQPDPKNLPQHVVLMAGLPLLWGDVGESDMAEPPGGGGDETTRP